MTMRKLTITMIGSGYVGLVSGTCFAEMGHTVICMDKDEAKISALKNEGRIPIYEPGLEDMVKHNIAAGRLSFTTDLGSCVGKSDAVFIGVGTPQGDDGRANLDYVRAAAADIARHLQGYTVVVNKSTVPVGSARMVSDIIHQINPQAEFEVVSNPEYLREGAAIEDFMQPDRITVGARHEKSWQIMRAVYKPLTDKGYRLQETVQESSELIKYASNAFLATKITFINEIASLCDKVGANVQDVAAGMGLDSRIGPKFLQPGPGYGGSCFPKDTAALAAIGADHGARQSIVEQTIAANQRIKEEMVTKIEQALGGSVNDKTIAVLGVAFKANTDDMRDAPALTILPALAKKGAKLNTFDPEAMENAKRLMPQLRYKNSLTEAVEGADATVVLTEWDVFKTMNLSALRQAMKGTTLVDLRNLFDAEQAADAGLKYTSLGRS